MKSKELAKVSISMTDENAEVNETVINARTYELHSVPALINIDFQDGRQRRRERRKLQRKKTRK